MLARRSVQYQALELPVPISTNELFVAFVRGGKPCRAPSKKYAAWVSEAGLRLNTQHAGIVEGAYAITIKVSRSWRGDLDNAAKCVCDLLQSHGVIENDKRAERVVIERADIDGTHVMIVSTKSGGGGGA